MFAKKDPDLPVRIQIQPPPASAKKANSPWSPVAEDIVAAAHCAIAHLGALDTRLLAREAACLDRECPLHNEMAMADANLKDLAAAEEDTERASSQQALYIDEQLDGCGRSWYSWWMTG